MSVDGGAPVADQELDTSGLRCPMPILKAKKALAAMAPGAVLAITTTDPSARGDFEAFARQTGNVLLAQLDAGDGALRHWLRRKG